MRVLVATDAWRPQINGVVRSLEQIAAHAASFNAEMRCITPAQFRTLPLPGYPEIRLALARRGAVARLIRDANPDHVHIATEGPVGWATRAACLAAGRSFTTSYHTRFPEYLAARLLAPQALSWAVLRRFHNAGAGVMVSTPGLGRELHRRGFRNLLPWSRGVDADLFRPRPKDPAGPAGIRALNGVARPLLLYVGRLAVEKNLESFLSLDVPGTKVIVGDGPARTRLERAFPAAKFLGAHTGETLAQIYAACDVFVFPSRTDTFGIVLLEALASGLPVAAFPVPGPLDVIGGSGAGALHEDLGEAVRRALHIDPHVCRAHGERFTWRESAGQFFGNIRGLRQDPESFSHRASAQAMPDPAQASGRPEHDGLQESWGRIRSRA